MADSLIAVSPENELKFTLTAAEATPKCFMELRHKDAAGGPVAFKVKTTQPRRYLVRPNQGLIEPGGSQQVQILLVEKDKLSLLQSYQRLGQTALDNSKDKFLVQSVQVDPSQSEVLKDYDQLTTLWTAVGGGGGGAAHMTAGPVSNQKLHVRHSVPPTQEIEKDVVAAAPPAESMSKEELVAEMNALRRKYDELVGFSVNLTAERDILNNTLEQTKRDLNRELAKNTHAGGNAAAGGNGMEDKSSSNSWMVLLIAAVLAMLVGIRMEQMEMVDFVKEMPILRVIFREEEEASVVIEPEL